MVVLPTPPLNDAIVISIKVELERGKLRISEFPYFRIRENAILESS